jgi:hypothetical protein
MQPTAGQAAVLPQTPRFGVRDACLLALSAAIFLPAVNGYWLADDFGFVREFYRYPWGDALWLFLGDWSRHRLQEYRPLFAVSILADLRLWGLDSFGPHLTNLALHVVACALVWRLAATAPGAGRLAPVLALSFFALAPMHAEPVAWISARGHALVSIFILGAMILLRRFEERGGRLRYAASLACAAAALATQEIAVALPALLLARDVVDAPRRDRPWWRRTLRLHAPFWVLLAGYLGFRYLIFAVVSRPTLSASVPARLHETSLAFRTLFVDPPAMLWLPGSILGRAVRGAIKLGPLLLLLVAPLVSRSTRGLRTHARETIFFAALWPFFATAVLFGARSPRHLYLASIGVAVALGLAGSRILSGRRLVSAAGAAILLLTLGLSAIGLASYVDLYARNGRLSRDLAREIDRAYARAAPDSRAVIAIIPDFPRRQASFWDYFYPDAVAPPFRRGRPFRTIPSFASCRCIPAEWKAEHSETLRLLNDASDVYLVHWDEAKAGFATRVLTPSAFWQSPYASRDGPLLRPYLPGLESPTLPYHGPVISRGGSSPSLSRPLERSRQ